MLGTFAKECKTGSLFSHHFCRIKTMTTSTPEDLYNNLLLLDNDARTIRQVNNSVLLLPVESLWKLLHTSHSEIWESVRARNPSLPVAKTVARTLTSSSRPLGRSATIRLIRALPNGVIDEVIRPYKADYVWLTGKAWIGLFSGGLFQNQTTKAFWVQFVSDATVLNAETLRADQGMEEIWQHYASSPLVSRFGCTALRERFPVDSAQMDDNQESSEQTITRYLAADALTVLLRILAWYVADIIVEYFWDAVEQDEMSEMIPFECVIPAYDVLRGEWSNPMLGALEHLGKLCGWQRKQKVTTYLGNRWAISSDTGGVDGPARVKLLRYWVQAKKGRPKFQTFLGLVLAVTEESPRLKDADAEGRAYDAWIQASVLRLGETLALVRSHLTHIGLTHNQVSSVMSAYAQEYRFARAALGRPMLSRD